MNSAHVAAYVGSTLGKALTLAPDIERNTGISGRTFMSAIMSEFDGLLGPTSGFGKLAVSNEISSGMAQAPSATHEISGPGRN